jgi:NADH:ubiquinone oxidoreductase subunit 6 (subunit J)/NADH:ubiquinone oxidoreductase subunit K
MILPAVMFYVFAAVAIVAGMLVVSGRNPVYSVLFLILAFFNAAGLFVLMGAEFLAMILVIVYVGAVAVLFLFVVMMLDIDFAELRRGFLRYLPVGTVVGLILLAELVLVFAGWSFAPWRHRRRRGALAARRARPQQYPGARRHPLHPLCVRIPGGGHGAAGGDDRRHRADLAASPRLAAAAGRHPARSQPRPVGRRRRGAAGWRARRRAGRRGGRTGPMTIGLAHYLTVAAILFTLGIFGIFLNRKNVIIILMSIELMLLAVNINFVAFSVFLNDLVGQVFAMFVLTVAAAEAAIGLAILVVYFRNRGSIRVEDINMMKG